MKEFLEVAMIVMICMISLAMLACLLFSVAAGYVG